MDRSLFLTELMSKIFLNPQILDWDRLLISDVKGDCNNIVYVIAETFSDDKQSGVSVSRHMASPHRRPWRWPSPTPPSCLPRFFAHCWAQRRGVNLWLCKLNYPQLHPKSGFVNYVFLFSFLWFYCIWEAFSGELS